MNTFVEGSVFVDRQRCRERCAGSGGAEMWDEPERHRRVGVGGSSILSMLIGAAKSCTVRPAHARKSVELGGVSECVAEKINCGSRI
jgi:hypothetical protein